MSRTFWQEAQDDFEHHYKSARAHVYRVPDAAEGVGRSNGKINTNVRDAPSDFIVTQKAVTFYAEVKATKDTTRFKFAGIQPEQWKTCRTVVRNEGQYRFYIYSFSHDQWYDVPGNVILEAKDSGKGSLTFTEMESFQITINGK